MRLDGFDVLASNVEEMKGCYKATLDFLDKKEGKETFSASLKMAMSQQMVNANDYLKAAMSQKRPMQTLRVCLHHRINDQPMQRLAQ